ncbi:hypothetical protein Sa4125_30370 [Aureimonas sp. SA4125]|uniref:hypothetical protein n=1 Tax=Aureimonas sp. SA4125 TaxID=2826993 RepID=UPI001CC4D623|nr:hypothetical protein [Aureimonas sp. SA4125]BDA85495.1 hypothetical protein Sa4125_30370 [Aureimonas sp. SA4125]
MLAAIAAALRNAASAVATGFRYCWWAIDWTIGLPGRLLGGGSAGSIPHPTCQPPAGDPAAEIADMVANRGRTRAVRGALPLDLEPSPDGTDPVSATVYAYARATPTDRRQVSLEALSPDQVSWLLRLRPHDLDRLAAASGLVCGRLARGMGGGALGVEPCRRREPELSEAELAGREEPSTVESFAERVRRRKGAVPRLVMG